MKRFFGVALSAVLPLCIAAGARADGGACTLVSPGELQALLGSPVSGLSPMGMPGAAASMCMGHTPTASVLLRLAPRSKPGGANEATGIAIAKQMGAQVEVKTVGAITCSTMIPPASLADHGFNTTCSIAKKTSVAAIEVTAKSQKDMVAMDRLRGLAEKVAERF
jgi:hypothetical protein